MKKSNKEYFTSSSKTTNSLTYRKWLRTIRAYSKKYQKFGSFLPAQERLLREVYENITKRNEKVVSFTAPPSSGKTHVIVLCAAYLNRKGFETCIITPNAELKSDFIQEMKEINGSPLAIPVESINTYRKARGKFDFALMDEAHNLRSAVELDDTITKSFHFIKGDGLFEFITSGTNKARYVTKELNIETGSDILKKMRATENKREARYLLRTLSQWRVFCVVFDKICTLKFLFADPKKRNLLPKGRLFLFSATRLDKEELTFYCDIPQRVLRISGKKMTKFIAKENVEYRCLSLHSDVDKITCATTLLKKNLSTLILLNNNSNCLSWNDALSKTCGDRVVVVQSGLKYSDRVKRFEKFSRSRDKILLTASNVYWEGITIKGLRLLIIPNMPFPQPTLLELAGGRTPQYKKIAERRLIQGMGRIGRMSDEKGICLLLFNPTKSFRYLKVTSIDEIQALIRNLKI